MDSFIVIWLHCTQKILNHFNLELVPQTLYMTSMLIDPHFKQQVRQSADFQTKSSNSKEDIQLMLIPNNGNNFKVRFFKNSFHSFIEKNHYIIMLGKWFKNLKTFALQMQQLLNFSCSFYYKCVTIVIYDRNGSGLYYKTFLIYNPRKG